jgi:nascent polypeptide-associated complex subunit alpha
MPSVQEELEALRQKSLAKTHGAKLADASGLSTPEQEDQAIQSKREKNRIGNYKKDAEANLKSYNEAKIVATNLKDDNKKNTTPNTEKMAAEDPKTAPEEDDDDDIPQLEEVDDDDGVPMLEELEDGAAGAAAGGEAGERTLNRAERKARRMMEKLGMKKVPGITQVTLKMGGRQGVFTIPQPDVFEKNGSYIVFGEARQGGQGPGGPGGVSAAQQQAQAVQQLAQQMGQAGAGAAGGGMEVPKIEELPDTDADGAEDVTPVDETGVDAKDIELVVSQAGCSHAKAVAALKENDNDLVNAIMSLTS